MNPTPTSEPARSMYLLDEPVRNALIAQADNVIDIRDRLERKWCPRYAQPDTDPDYA